MRRAVAAAGILIAGLTVAALSGCMVGPDFVRPPTAAKRVSQYYQRPADWTDPNMPEHIGAWWRTFDDPLIDELVERAMANNYDLKAAAAALLEAEAVLAQTRGAQVPSLSYSANRTRSKSPIAPGSFGGFSIDAEPQTTYNHQLNISYLVDLFGKLRRATRAAEASYLATAANQQALVHAIVAQVVRVRVQIATQQRLLEVARSIIKTRQETLQIVERRYDQGLLSPVDVYLARENLASARAQEPLLERAVALSQHGLELLLGQPAGSSKVIAPTLPELPDLEPAPIGVPAALLDRRPDVQTAELRLAAATEQIGVSVANLYPDLTLTAAGGYRADNFDALFDPQQELYSAVASLAAPIFQGGRLRADVAAAEARAQQAAADYAGVVLTAMREVEDALVREQTLLRQLKHIEIRLAEARRAEELARQRYSRGVDNILTVLETERRRRSAENELVNVRGELYNARIDLFLALGGDWGPMPAPQPIPVEAFEADRMTEKAGRTATNSDTERS